MKHEPTPFPRIHSANCHCPRCSPWNGRKASLGARFRAAADPRDLAALRLGAIAGVLLVGIIAVADNFEAIAVVLTGLLGS